MRPGQRRVVAGLVSLRRKIQALRMMGFVLVSSMFLPLEVDEGGYGGGDGGGYGGVHGARTLVASLVVRQVVRTGARIVHTPQNSVRPDTMMRGIFIEEPLLEKEENVVTDDEENEDDESA
ncbi:hypothetical protein L1987_06435 [Smallanthus sonchifolius]|uniref:Uncharacterized protein n=1 Tax=Smallanthus sonchifolius TaxID=185202 RepID=A0ACB9JY78_9ASTR|nr:hypothetical protein L1987_06435 [Smallanthus sonchifolius]